MSDSMNLDEGQTHPTIHATFLPRACVCTWERVDDHWEMVRLVPHCVMHRYFATRDRHTERTPQGPGPFVPDSEDDEQRRPDD